jgi:hypothetical protein
VHEADGKTPAASKISVHHGCEELKRRDRRVMRTMISRC